MDETFSVRINEGPEQQLTVKTGTYIYAAAAAIALLKPDAKWPVHVEIWSPSYVSQYGSYHYLISQNEYGHMVVAHAVKSP